MDFQKANPCRRAGVQEAIRTTGNRSGNAALRWVLLQPVGVPVRLCQTPVWIVAVKLI
jgi:hypothetical protein